MGLLKLNLFMKPNRQRRRRRRRIQARNGLIDSPARITDSSCHSLSSQATTEYSSVPNLPDDIWSHIHSLMPMEDAAPAACVSWAFATSWRRHPDLTFSEESLGLNKETFSREEKASNFTSRVERVLTTHSGIGVKKLRFVVGSFSNPDRCYLDRWLQFAVKPGIEELVVNLNGSYNFPCRLLSGGAGDSLQYKNVSMQACKFTTSHVNFYLGNVVLKKKYW